MNYLAHIFLARQSGPAMVGAMLGDFVKADFSGKYPREVEREITLHRNIDSYTDSHPVVKSAVQLFGDGRRRYAGIVLDVYYDHLLTRHWDAFSDVPRKELIARFYQALAEHEALLPERLRDIAPRIIAQDWLSAYEDIEGVDMTVARISQRLSRNGHLLREGLADLREHRAAIDQGFDLFFPELVQFSRERRASIA